MGANAAGKKKIGAEASGQKGAGRRAQRNASF